MDLNDLALFARVVDRGSFTAAARALSLPKSSVTRGIARLERELGVRLVQRTTRQRGITDAGRELYERVRGAVGALEEATEAVREQGHEPRGVVRLTANPDITEMGVPESIAALRVKQPSIHVELVLTTRVVDLVAESIDLAIRAGRLADSTLIAKPVGSTDLGLYAAKTYVKRRNAPKKLADLADHDCILFRGHRGHSTWELEGPRGTQRIDIAGIASADEFRFIDQMIRAGAGIGLLPEFMGARAQLVRVLPEHRVMGAPLHLVMPSAAFVPARVTIVRDHLAAHLTQLFSRCREKAAS
jgi:DNA-binding transcriptional LysR family regulator